MSVTPRCLLQATPAPAVDTVVLTSLPNTRTIIDKFSGVNVTAAAVAITIKIIPAGGSPATGNIVVKDKVLGANEDFGFAAMVGQKLEPGDTVSVIASAAAAINLRISGTLITT